MNYTKPLDLEVYQAERRQTLRANTAHFGECIAWTGKTNGSGYGGFWYKPLRENLAHRVSWILERGPIPAGLTVDHLCRVRLCVNVRHMELVTIGENTRRGGGIEAAAAAKRSATHCKHGHAFDAANTYIDNRGRRACKACRKATSARAYLRRAA